MVYGCIWTLYLCFDSVVLFAVPSRSGKATFHFRAHDWVLFLVCKGPNDLACFACFGTAENFQHFPPFLFTRSGVIPRYLHF